MNTSAASTLTAKIESLPTLPTVAVRVLNITADPESSANDLMNVISPDVSLTTKILKIANSPFYGLTREISTLQHAVTILGFKEIRNLVVSTVAFESFKNLKQDKKYDINLFWKHSFCCGLAAKIIASYLNNKSNELFVAGLVHDIGKLAMYIAFPVEFLEVMDIMRPLKLKYTAFEVEKDVFGMTHDEVGMKLMKRWMFPESLLMAVGYHHHPQKTENKSLFPIIVHVADILTHVYEMRSGDEESDSIDAELHYNEAVNLSRPFEIGLNVSDLHTLQQHLVESIKKEENTINLFF
ncbi:MAG: HDOD domain-containing protein [Candidatus Scalindua sp. AMX11]|nr:MAG: HDOD domain-containing protein [Candidatus Scalindua sp.]NOG82878.1 HDOD domain-containing protein [Planctomycetota bacterium]RZV86221.1 MAG: HDOD domain-containing protein [Candidatus Scalindua sp. SCAELEC01]TDE65842.1 MAG: HDOD domain-containing protein [Candidatus Scalindua sp. AMX11]GJQ58349.1 MAG: histidine kinase [Candidatus Scalindua sp.]